MIEEFLQWFEVWLEEMLDIFVRMCRYAYFIFRCMLTAPIWLLPFIYWLLFVRRDYMKQTNEQYLQSIGVDTNRTDEVFSAAADDICAVCNAEISKNLCPSNPTCEGRWCDEAVELYLNEEVKETTDGRKNM